MEREMSPSHPESIESLNMPLVKAMETQRSIRRLKSDPVDDDVLLRLIELALKAPSRNDEKTLRAMRAVDWQAEHYEDIPVFVIACLRWIGCDPVDITTESVEVFPLPRFSGRSEPRVRFGEPEH